MAFTIPIIDSIMYPIEVLAIEKKGEDTDAIRTRAKMVRGKKGDKTIVFKLINGREITVTNLKDLWITRDVFGAPRKFFLALRKIGEQYVALEYKDGNLQAPDVNLLQTYIIEEEKRLNRFKPPITKADLLVNLLVVFAVIAIGLSMFMVLQEIQKLIPMLGGIMEANAVRIDWIIANMNKTV